MKDDLCLLFTEAVQEDRLSFIEVGKLSGMSKTQVNNIINHNGREVSMEKIMNGLVSMGYKIDISIGRD